MSPGVWPPSNRYAERRGVESPGINDGGAFRNENVQVPADSKTPPYPGSESAGPALYDLINRTTRALEIQTRLIHEAIPLLNSRHVVTYAAGQTDGSGNLDLVLYRVPQGMQFVCTRVNVEDGTHTPGNPFTSATGWIALIRGDKWQPGSIIDMWPNPPAGNANFIPILFSDGNMEAGLFRGGETIGLHIASGPPTTDILVRVQGFEEPV